MLALVMLACSSSPATLTVPTADDTGVPTCIETETVVVTEVEVLDLDGTTIDDWRPVLAGNWPDPILDEDCGASGALCVDCLHLPSGAYARWYDGGNGVWFGAVLGTLTFQDWEDLGGLGDDGVYYTVDGLRACMPVYDALAR